ncbi:MAG: hypothetical protein LBQ24_04535 [Candidatus Peribacteria bacterium]|nr:hypothetical protein [Candidatus Peribacteria bacterium]
MKEDKFSSSKAVCKFLAALGFLIFKLYKYLETVAFFCASSISSTVIFDLQAEKSQEIVHHTTSKTCHSGIL